jgi:hypothetical protein
LSPDKQNVRCRLAAADYPHWHNSGALPPVHELFKRPSYKLYVCEKAFPRLNGRLRSDHFRKKSDEHLQPLASVTDNDCPICCYQPYCNHHHFSIDAVLRHQIRRNRKSCKINLNFQDAEGQDPAHIDAYSHVSSLINVSHTISVLFALLAVP